MCWDVLIRAVGGQADKGEKIENIVELLEREDQEFKEVVEQGGDENSDEEDEAVDDKNDNEEQDIPILNEWQVEDFDALAIGDGRQTHWE
ncbi:hypothetical protein GUJ93_ZPchr0011g27559 [Zizania palustris]|uniref:Uncharacterized protein n=1 Tax=Zizania palustris TaxID=103762 RepID=A0A8J5WK93_ZIZPA|nr:hypothetical protein GUJ93_ZPchr0011g27559 [Zizania palustris]